MEGLRASFELLTVLMLAKPEKCNFQLVLWTLWKERNWHIGRSKIYLYDRINDNFTNVK